jgi:hypothetical protein
MCVAELTIGSSVWQPALNAGMSPHQPHEHSEKELMIETEGMGEIILESRVKKMAPGCAALATLGKLVVVFISTNGRFEFNEDPEIRRTSNGARCGAHHELHHNSGKA